MVGGCSALGQHARDHQWTLGWDLGELPETGAQLSRPEEPLCLGGGCVGEDGHWAVGLKDAGH